MAREDDLGTPRGTPGGPVYRPGLVRPPRRAAGAVLRAPEVHRRTDDHRHHLDRDQRRRGDASLRQVPVHPAQPALLHPGGVRGAADPARPEPAGRPRARRGGARSRRSTARAPGRDRVPGPRDRRRASGRGAQGRPRGHRRAAGSTGGGRRAAAGDRRPPGRSTSTPTERSRRSAASDRVGRRARSSRRNHRAAVRPRRRAHPDRQGPRRGVEADVRRVPARPSDRTASRSGSSTSTTTTTSTSTGCPATTACATS